METIKVGLLLLIIIWLGFGTLVLCFDTDFNYTMIQTNLEQTNSGFKSEFTHKNLEDSLRNSFSYHSSK